MGTQMTKDWQMGGTDFKDLNCGEISIAVPSKLQIYKDKQSQMCVFVLGLRCEIRLSCQCLEQLTSIPTFTSSPLNKTKQKGIPAPPSRSLEHLIPRAERWEQPQCPSTDRERNKRRCVLTMEYYSAFKKDIPTWATPCVNLEDMMLTEIRQSQKDK